MNKQMKISLLKYTCLIFYVVISLIKPISAQNLPVTPAANGHVCWDENLVSEPEQSFEEFIAEVGEGRGLYVNLRPSSAATLIGDWTYRVPINETVEILFQLYSPEATSQTIRYIVLLDELQIDPIANEEENLFFDVRLEAKALNTFSLSIPPLDEGTHDVIIIPIPSPTNSLESDGSIGTSNYRLSLIAGERLDPTDLASSITYETLSPSETVTSRTNTHNLTLVLPGNIDPWTFPKPSYEIPANSNLTFDVLTGYISSSVPEASNLEQPAFYQFALLFLINFQQVPYNESETVIYRAVPLNTAYSRIPISLPVPQNLPNQELMVIKIDNPRIPMCILRGPEDGYFLNQTLYYNRVGFQVLE